MGWWMAFAGIWMLIFWGPIIALVVWGIFNLSRDKDQSAERKDSWRLPRAATLRMR